MINLPNRKSIRLPNYDYSQEGLYFVTICTQNRECIFGEIENGKMILNHIGKMVDYWWQQIPHKYPCIELDTCQIMPNHVHGIINICGRENRAPTLGQIMAYFKYQSTKQINDFVVGVGSSDPSSRPVFSEPYPKIFQRNYYEHIIRNEKELFEIREYICTNPQMWERDRNNLESP